MLKKILNCFLIIVLLSASFPVSAKATDNWNNENFYIFSNTRIHDFASGNGTKESPYEVTNIEQLRQIENYNGKYFIQKNDIDGDNVQWEPLCSKDGFTGCYDGQNYKIANINISSQNDETPVGLFAEIKNSGTVQNVMLKNIVVIAGSDAAGSIAGYNYGTIENCFVKCKINRNGQQNANISYNAAGGIAGYSTGKISGCSSLTNDDSNYDIQGTFACIAGGIVGLNSGIIDTCYSTCRIKGNADSSPLIATAGGISGMNYGTLQYCKSQSSEICAKIYSGGASAGGISGINLGNGKIEKCYFKGNAVTAFATKTNYGELAGSIAGSNGNRWDGNGGTIKNNVAVKNDTLPIYASNKSGTILDNYTDEESGFLIINEIEEKLEYLYSMSEKIDYDLIPPEIEEIPSGTPENKLQCASSCTVEERHNKTFSVAAFEDSLDKLKLLTGNVAWQSEDTNVATVDNIGFILPTNATKYSSENGTYQTWRSTGMLSVHGISEGTTTITGTAADDSKVSFQVTVTEPEIIQGSNTEGNGGSLVLGEESSGSGNSSAAEFFPANWSLKSSVFPVEISKSEGEDGSYTLRGTVGIGKGDWLDDDATWSKYKKNVSDANKYTGRVDCLNSYKDTWGVKSVTAVTTDKFEALPKLSVMGYFENTYDKNGNLVSAAGKLAADAKWSGSISWQFVTPIGPLYLNLSGSGKLSGTLEPQYDYDNKSLKIASGSLKLTPSVSLEGGYGIDKVATIGAQGTLSVPITLVPASKGEFEAKAAIHVKLVFVIDWTHDLATYKTTLWDTTKQSKAMKASNIVQLSEGTISEMDTSFDAFSGDWNPNEDTRKLMASNRSISETVTDSIMMLQEGILPSSLPIQAQIGRKNVMVFQAYDNTRTTLNSTVLKYSILENGVWSEPKAILDDGCADMYADMKVVDGRLALVWQKEKKTIAGDVETDSERVLKDIAVNSEIYFTLFDEGTNAFLNPVKVTDNNYYDMMPRIVNADDEITVSWVRNDEADLMQETGSNTIYTVKWNGTSFGEETPLSKASGTIDDYVVYKDENGIQSIFMGQANGIAAMFNTNGDVIDSLSELMLASSDGKISSLNYMNGKVSFISKGTLYIYDASSGTLTSAQAGESAFGSETQYCSNGEKAGYIWSIYDEESNMGKILASMKTEDGYSEPITICEKEDTMWRYFSPIINEDGNWEIVINALDTETSNNALLYVTKKTEKRLELAGASINENDIVDGLTGIDYFVTNTQDTTINSIEIEITLKDGSKITKTVPVTLLPGESKASTAYVDLKDVDSTQNVTLSIIAENQEDKSGCVVTDQIGQADISVEAVSMETKDNVEIIATLKNNSSVNASTVLHLYGDENKTTELKKQESISLKANGTAQAKFTLKKKDIAYNKNQAAYLTLVAETGDGDYNEDNNTAYIILYQKEDSQTPPADKPGDQTKPIKVGYTATANTMNYRVTKVNVDGTGEVVMTGTSRKKTDKKFTSLKVGDSITINGKSFKITTIGKNAFNGFAKLKTVTVGKNISSIDDKAFYKCAALTKISIPSKVTKIGSQAFSDCKKLKSVTIGKNVTLIGDKAFYKCISLTKITIPNKVTKIGKQAFSGCKKLKIITIKTKRLTSKKVGNNAFKGIYGKATIKVPKEKLKTYKKLLKAKGVSSKAKIKK